RRRRFLRVIRHCNPLVGKTWQRRPLPLFELARVLVRFDHVANRIVNADHGINVMGCRPYIRKPRGFRRAGKIPPTKSARVTKADTLSVVNRTKAPYRRSSLCLAIARDQSLE